MASTSKTKETLVPPLGSKLVDLIVPPERVAGLKEYANHLPSLILSERSVCDLELLATGGFSPLDRFMAQADHQRVLDEMRLATGHLFPIPVTLPVKPSPSIQLGQEVALRNGRNDLLALMTIEEIYEWDRGEVARKVFGAEDLRHPLIAEMYRITVVSGLPRSGTSMMMQMLEAGGMPVLTDGIRGPDADNPKGYYEFEPVKQLSQGNHTWLAEAQGKAVKVIAALLEHLPRGYAYRVIFMHRRMEEILASQRQMLLHRGHDGDWTSDEELGGLFDDHLQKVRAWLAVRPDVAAMDVDYNRLLTDPRPTLEQVNRFLGGGLNVVHMMAAADRDLYRNRASNASVGGHDASRADEEFQVKSRLRALGYID